MRPIKTAAALYHAVQWR